MWGRFRRVHGLAVGGLLAALALGTVVAPALAGPATGQFISDSGPASATVTKSDSFLGFSDADAKVDISWTGCQVKVTAEAVVEDGASTSASESTTDPKCHITVAAPNIGELCPDGKSVTGNVDVTHVIVASAAVPGNKTSATISFAAGTATEGSETKLSGTLEAAAAKKVGKDSSEQKLKAGLNGELKKSGGAKINPGEDIDIHADESTELKGNASVEISQKTELDVLHDKSRSFEATKTFQIPFKVPCGFTRRIRGSSFATASISASELTGKSDDRTASLTLSVNNTMQVNDASTVGRARRAGADGVTVTTGLDSYLAPPPATLARHLSPLAAGGQAVGFGETQGQNLTIESSDESVLRVVPGAQESAAGSISRSFKVIPEAPGTATITARMGASPATKTIQVVPLTSLPARAMITSAPRRLTLVENTAAPIVVSRSPFVDIATERTGFAYRSSDGASGRETFGRGEVTRALGIRGLKPGKERFTISGGAGQPSETKVRVLPIERIRVDAPTALEVDPGDRFRLGFELSHPAGKALGFSVRSSDPDVLAVPGARGSVPAGATLGFFDFSARRNGTARLKIDVANGASDTVRVIVDP